MYLEGRKWDIELLGGVYSLREICCETFVFLVVN
jgi:hypothetical protein